MFILLFTVKNIFANKFTGSDKMNVRRGEIYYADLSPVVGSEQGGTRPVLIVQNDVGNKFSPTVIAAAITSQKYKTSMPTHIRVNTDGCGLAKDSIVKSFPVTLLSAMFSTSLLFFRRSPFKWAGTVSVELIF